jgi:membrane protease YdiL (CAAX protease family)
MTNIIVALIFGLGHLPAAFKLIEPSFYEISRILLLNGIPGVVFGWLYWSRGLRAAMTAHFVADLMIHVFL